MGIKWGVCGGASRKKMQIFAAKVRWQLRIDVLKMRQTCSGRKGLEERWKGVLHSEQTASLFTVRVCCYLLHGWCNSRRTEPGVLEHAQNNLMPQTSVHQCECV